jgi:lipoate-protein ligase A
LSHAPLYTVSPPDAALDVAVSHALLRDAAERGVPALRGWIPPPAVSFGRLDLLLAGRGQAIEAASAAGLQPVRRLAGGRAAAIGAGTVCVGWASPSPELAGMGDRYLVLADLILAALGTLGVPARVGELPGEWCPGAWSVLAGGGKVGGLAQRVIRGGAWTEAVVVVSGARQLAAALDRVQQALGLPWDPATLGALSAARPELTPSDALAALIDSASSALGPVRIESALPPELITAAERLRIEHDLGSASRDARYSRVS